MRVKASSGMPKTRNLDEIAMRSEALRENGMSPLIERVMGTEAFRELAGELERAVDTIDVSGLRGSSVALLAAALRENLGRPVLVCLPDREQAEDLVSDLATIGGGRAFFFPEKEFLTGRLDLKERITLRGERNHCLDRIRLGEADIVATSLLGFIGKAIPPDVLARSRFELRVGEEVDLEAVRSKLASIGYEASSFVEEAGYFAVRGGIVDIFDPAWDCPARIELADDRIQSIRLFDIDDQKSRETVSSVTILPAAGIMLEEDSFDRLESRLRDNGFPRKTIELIRSEMEHGRPAWLLRRYAPAMGMNGSLLEFFPKPPILILVDAGRLAESYEELVEKRAVELGKQDDEFPFLDLHSYIHPIDYHEEYEIPRVRVWTVPETGKTGRVIPFAVESHPSVMGKMDTLTRELTKLRRRGMSIYVFSESDVQRERLADMLGEYEEMVHLPVGWITEGFVWPDAQVAVLTDHEIFHRILPRPGKKPRKRRLQALRTEHLRLGDYVVHVDFGIGRFVGLERVRADGDETECITIRYAGGDKIYVPVDRMHLVEKYVGKEGYNPPVDSLGSSKWARTKEKTRRALEDVARELIELYAEREVAEGFAFSPDTPWQKGLEASFPFEETPHQLAATRDIKRDMESPRPMDRLVCGDVGYGKTEVAVRAAFKAVNDGKQVAVLVPTTILAMQHLKTFRERMAEYPVRIEMLSRFKSTAEQKAIVKDLKNGKVDIVIGTHRLLSPDVGFADLGLLVVDEEHRFGVKSKEKLKRLRKGVDVLTLTATPIPRTLYMALSGLRGISLIETPPRNRHPIKTEILPFDEEKIASAVMNEIRRGGQVFFVHNRVASIYSMQAFLERLLPGVRFCVAHGQMSEKELERVIIDFLDKKFDVLVSTMIIESGLDFPDVNTIIINRADRFGLAQLYQLRGRVGRREQQAYAYLFLPRYLSLTENARKRLQAMEEFEELGSGYRLAMRDLEIRGAGNVLGVQQHGHVAAVGFDLYCKMLKQAVDEIQGKGGKEPPACRMEVRARAFMPDSYIEEQNERMEMYKRLADCRTTGEVEAIEAELRDRFGPLPVEASRLVETAKIRLLASELGASRVQVGPGAAEVEFGRGRALSRAQCEAILETFGEGLLFKSGKPFAIAFKPDSSLPVLEQVRKLLQRARDCDKKGVYPR